MDNSSKINMESDTQNEMEEAFQKLELSTETKSLVKKHLTREVFQQLKGRRTKNGGTLADVIRTGAEHTHVMTGAFVPEPEGYQVFALLLDPIIDDCHFGGQSARNQPPPEFGDLKFFENLDPEGHYIVSTRVRCGRNLEGFPFHPCLTEDQYEEIERTIKVAMESLEGELATTYYPLSEMDEDQKQKLIDDHYLFHGKDVSLETAGAYRLWPTGRGIFMNQAKTFLVWCNEEDQLRIISMQPGGDMGAVFRRFAEAVQSLEEKLPFARHERLGYLAFCPTNLGTAIRASVLIRLPNLGANRALLDELTEKLGLQIRGSSGVYTEVQGNLFDISNKKRLGLTEFEVVKGVYEGTLEIIRQERNLEKNTRTEKGNYFPCTLL
ncbi:arginine kinase Scy s 2-like [Oratosquilla oratoria]|uniref:arginine kinase Scy s 2-like n=1 Tax=Oratosquilla oratoria TaxID=337810 RepID=UPI003F769A10